MHTTPRYEASSVESSICNHETSNINIFHAPVPPYAGGKSKIVHAIDKALQNCMCKVVGEALQVNNSPAIAVNTTMEDKSPVNEFMVRVNVPEIIWFRYIIKTPLYSVPPPNCTVNRVNTLQGFSDFPSLDIDTPSTQSPAYIRFPRKGCQPQNISNVPCKFLIGNVTVCVSYAIFYSSSVNSFRTNT